MATLSGMLFILSGIFVTVDVILRKYFGVSSRGTDEICGYILAVGSGWAMAYALVNRVHVRVDALLVKFPRHIQGYLNLFAILMLNIFLAIVVWRMWLLVIDSFTVGEEANTVLRTPLGWPQSVWALGYTTFLFFSVLLFLEGVVECLRGKVKEMAVFLGPRSMQEEIEEALGAAEVTGASGAGDSPDVTSGRRKSSSLEGQS